MDQQRRMMMFFVLSFGTMFLWLKIGLPFFYPELVKKQAERAVAAQKLEEAEKDAQKTTDLTATTAPGDPSEKTGAVSEAEAAEAAERILPNYPPQRVTLGTPKPDDNSFMQVEVSSLGASITSLQLNDERYRELTDRAQPLRLLGEAEGSSRLTFDMRLDAIDKQLREQDLTLEMVHWEIDQASLTDHQVTFRYPAPDGSLEVLKTYTLRSGDTNFRDTDPDGYCLDVALQFRNLSDREVFVNYNLQGPVGFPLEEAENTRRYLVLEAGFLNGGSVRNEQLTAKEIADQAADRGGIEPLIAPIRYIGIDGQYFTTLVIPKENQTKAKWIQETQPLLTQRHRDVEKSLISLALQSNPIAIPAGQTVSHEYTLFAGPKRTALLQPFDAENIIEYGWFGAISKIMLAIMNFFHRTLFVPYGIAIILLTVIVRGAMYPISRRHALAAKRMKEMQPRFEEIRKKYENDKEKLARAQMDLMKESGFFSGCLPMLLQLPIFIGLYQALYVSVDLRMAEFLWIDNLAAPDRLFKLPFSIWFIGDDFNLLPMLTVALFVVQQKLFAPPPANEEQALQQKMMSYMMIFIGVMFYRVPAGLCVYFIASSLWAIAERKILDFHDTATDPAKKKGGDGPVLVVKGKEVTPATPKKPGWLQNVMASLDSAANPDAERRKKVSPPKKKMGR